MPHPSPFACGPWASGAVPDKSGCELDVFSLRENFYPEVKSHLRNAGKLMMEVLITFNDSDACRVYSSGRADA